MLKTAYNYPLPSVDWTILTPLIIVVCTGIAALIIEMLRPKHNNNAIVWTSLAGLTLAGWTVIRQFGDPDAETFGQMLVRDRPALVFQLILIVAGMLTIMFSEGYLRAKRIPYGEFYPLALWSLSGAMVMASSKNLLMIFIGLEILSIALYVLAGMSRQENRSEESAIKYFLLGAFASGFLLYGIAFFYGATGGLHLDLVAKAWSTNDQTSQGLLIFGMGLMLVGLGFKAAFAPFHQWTPDVYQGAPTNVTAFMAACSKVAAIAALYRILEATGAMQDLWFPVLYWVAIGTMVVGNLVALVQKDVKRILGYSSIANAGYVLVALLAHFKDPNSVGLGTTAFYLIAYTFMTVGTFAVVSLTAKDGKEGTRLQDLYGLYHRAPLAAALLVVFVCSLIGIPPLAGFYGKLLIFRDSVSAGLVPLAVILAINSVVSIYYYVGIVRAAYVADEGFTRNESRKPGFGVNMACLICAAGTLGVALFAGPLMDWLGFSRPSTSQGAQEVSLSPNDKLIQRFDPQTGNLQVEHFHRVIEGEK